MEVILLEDVKSLGKKGEIVKEFTIDYQPSKEQLKELSNNMLNFVFEMILLRS